MRISDWSSDVCSSDLQVLAGLLQVLQLLGEELVPLLHRRELLEGERVHPAEHRQCTLGRTQPLGLLVAVIGSGLGSLLALGHLTGELGSASWRERVCQYV